LEKEVAESQEEVCDLAEAEKKTLRDARRRPKRFCVGQS
jgi:hypothetical protein